MKTSYLTSFVSMLFSFSFLICSKILLIRPQSIQPERKERKERNACSDYRGNETRFLSFQKCHFQKMKTMITFISASISIPNMYISEEPKKQYLLFPKNDLFLGNAFKLPYVSVLFPFFMLSKTENNSYFFYPTGHKFLKT